EAMQEAAEIGIEEQIVVNGARRNRTADLVVVPDTTALGDVAALCGIDRVQMADALAVLGILPVGDKHLVLPDHRGGNDLIACFRPDGVLRIHVEFPELLAGERFVSSRPAVALADHYLHHIADLADRGGRPLAVQNALADVIYFPHLFPGRLVHRDHRGRARRWDVHVTLILAIRRADENQVAIRYRGRVGHIVRRGADLLDHVVLPDDLGTAVAVAFGIEA